MSNWNNFDEMKQYAKNTSSNCINLELDDNEMFEEYFSTFEQTELVKDCIELTKAFIRYTNNKSLLDVTQNLTNKLKDKWTEKFNSVDKGTTVNDAEKVEEQKNVPTSVVDDDGQLGLFGEVVDDEEQKKITDLKKKMKSQKLEYDATLSLDENQKVLDTAKKASDEEKKASKQVHDLKSKMDELYLEYDENMSYTENKAIYDKAVDKSNNPAYTFPFKIYFKGCDVRQLDHIFGENHQYTVKEICELMFKHGYKEYAGEVKLVYEKEENMFVPDFSSQRHG